MCSKSETEMNEKKNEKKNEKTKRSMDFDVNVIYIPIGLVG